MGHLIGQGDVMGRVEGRGHVMPCDLEERFRVDERLLSVALVLVRGSCVCVCVWVCVVQVMYTHMWRLPNPWPKRICTHSHCKLSV